MNRFRNMTVTCAIAGMLVVLRMQEPVNAQTKVGTTAAQFLGVSVGPRAIAMGGAFVAANDDATSLYWNPGAFQQAGTVAAGVLQHRLAGRDEVPVVRVHAESRGRECAR